MAALCLNLNRGFCLIRNSVQLKHFKHVQRRCLIFNKAGNIQKNYVRPPWKLTGTHLLIAFFPIVIAAVKSKKMSDEGSPGIQQYKDMDALLKDVDRLYNETEYMKIYHILVLHKELKNHEILWRLARATFEIAKSSSSKDDKKASTKEAYEYIKKALEISTESGPVHKWMAILIDAVNEYEGTKARISQSENVKFHIQRATELDPKDATSFYLLGVWCFSFADLPWYQRQIAAVIFATPPTSSYEEALVAFQKADHIEEDFYSMNTLMIGKTFMKLGKTNHAIKYLLKARNYPLRSTDDKQANEEATGLLKSLGVKP